MPSMASDCVEPTIAPDYHRARIRLLIAAHVAATVAAVVIQIFGLLPHFGLGGVLEFAQISLVSIWLAIGSGKCSRRWLKSFACFAAIVLAANGPRSMALFSGMLRYNFMAQFVLLELTMAASAWLASAAVVAAAKKWWPKFDLVRVEPNAPAPPVQFSIRNLLLLLLVTAIILTIARGVRADFAESDGSVLTFYWLTPMVAI